MVSVAKLAGFVYYATQALLDYMSCLGSSSGLWFGSGAHALALAGEVTRSAFNALARGFAPDGVTKLVQNAGRKDRFVGFDLTFSAPKSLSAVWALERSSEVRKAIEQALLDATRDALRCVEQCALYTRRGRQGSTVERAVGMVASLWLHATSRANDPQLHVHVAVKNSCRRSDGTWGTILGITAKDKGKTRRKSRSAYFVIKRAASQIFRESLAERVAAIGYSLTRTHDGGFEVEGVSKSLLSQWSSRRMAIEQDLKARGVSGASEAAKSALRTRTSKKHVAPGELRRRWQEQAQGFDVAQLRIHESRQASFTVPEELRARVASLAQARVMGQRVVANETKGPTPPLEQELTLTDAHRQAPGEQGRGAKKQVTVERGSGAFGQADDVRALRAAATIGRVLAHARHVGSHRVTRANLWLSAKTTEYLSRSTFSPAEKRALLDVTRTRGSVQYLSGASGERIASLLKTAASAWTRQGYRVLLATPSKTAAEKFERETGIKSLSLSGLDRGMRTNRGLVRGYVSALGKAVTLGPRPVHESGSRKPRLALGFSSGRSFVSYALASASRFIRLDRKCVVVVHQADALPLTERAALIKRLHKSGAKVVFLDVTRPASAIAAAIQRDSPTQRERIERTKAQHDTQEEERAEREQSRNRTS
jgi:conjugative relaxase-like TrwC/TraI family protein